MRTITITLPNDNAYKLIKDLELNNVLYIVKVDENDSFALPGDLISINNFKDWIESAENAPVVTLQNAKTKWHQRKQQLKSL